MPRLYTYIHEGYPLHIDLDQLEAIECQPNTDPPLKESDVRLTFKSRARTTLTFEYKSGAKRFAEDLRNAWASDDAKQARADHLAQAILDDANSYMASKQRTENSEP